MDPKAAYERSYQRIRSIVNDQNAETEVDTCPGWTVKDVVAHMADFFSVYKSDPEGGFSQGWGDNGVKARSDRSLGEVFGELDEHLKDPGGLFESRLAPVAVADALAHEQDIRSALDEPGADDDEGIVPAVEMGLSFLEHKANGADLPTLRITTEDIDKKIGDGEPSVTLETSTFELFRTLHGRRTVDQVKSLNWSGDPEPWMDHLFLFGPTQREVESTSG